MNDKSSMSEKMENIVEEVKSEAKEMAKDSISGSIPTKVEIPVYEKFKGKQLHGSKMWKVDEKVQKTVNALSILWIGSWVVIILIFIFLRPTGFIDGLLFASMFIPPAILGIYMFRVALKKHKEDPIDIKYYDVDYEQNYLTGEGYDNTREISKEEFFGKKEYESSTESYIEGPKES